jgi:hypothetical protein
MSVIAVKQVHRVRPRLSWRVVAADGLWLVGIAWSVPLAVLALGIPIALAVVLLLWAGRSALGAF